MQTTSIALLRGVVACTRGKAPRIFVDLAVSPVCAGPGMAATDSLETGAELSFKSLGKALNVDISLPPPSSAVLEMHSICYMNTTLAPRRLIYFICFHHLKLHAHRDTIQRSANSHVSNPDDFPNPTLMDVPVGSGTGGAPGSQIFKEATGDVEMSESWGIPEHRCPYTPPNVLHANLSDIIYHLAATWQLPSTQSSRHVVVAIMNLPAQHAHTCPPPFSIYPNYLA
ncbi:hypothetical protein CPB85DRAFT_1253629 [Mucidula mucida]|nr:hypothetical protein CPB85DRAFT_1253629 [Mucidula mucida]